MSAISLLWSRKKKQTLRGSFFSPARKKGKKDRSSLWLCFRLLLQLLSLTLLEKKEKESSKGELPSSLSLLLLLPSLLFFFFLLSLSLPLPLPAREPSLRALSLSLPMPFSKPYSNGVANGQKVRRTRRRPLGARVSRGAKLAQFLIARLSHFFTLSFSKGPRAFCYQNLRPCLLRSSMD